MQQELTHCRMRVSHGKIVRGVRLFVVATRGCLAVSATDARSISDALSYSNSHAPRFLSSNSIICADIFC